MVIISLLLLILPHLFGPFRGSYMKPVSFIVNPVQSEFYQQYMFLGVSQSAVAVFSTAGLQCSYIMDCNK